MRSSWGDAFDRDDLERAGCATTAMAGFLLPALLVGYGVVCVLTRTGVMPGRHAVANLRGANAVAFGVALAGLGLALHFRFAWQDHARLHVFAPIGMGLGLLTFILAVGWLMLRAFGFGPWP